MNGKPLHASLNSPASPFSKLRWRASDIIAIRRIVEVSVVNLINEGVQVEAWEHWDRCKRNPELAVFPFRLE